MHRNLLVDVDRNSWPTRGASRFPATFPLEQKIYSLDIPSMLLMIGFLTTPTAATGVTLSEFWAWVRYLAAVADHRDLRLTTSFARLDPHQKTILSDDFGMGAPMVWLTERLDLQDVCDGRYFVEHVAASVGAFIPTTARRGPNKTPDFVARDATGVWHVIECKGTQSGLPYLKTAMGDAGDPSEGGVAQKRSIIFPRRYTGQRLVAGLSISAEGSAEASRLRIIDPEPEDPFAVNTAALVFAEDAAARAVTARALRLAGFEASAEATASPFGIRPSDRPSKVRRVEEARRRTVDARTVRAREELRSAGGRQFVFEDGVYRGRNLEFDLPRALYVSGRPVTRVTIRQGVNRDVLAELAERPTVEEPLTRSGVNWVNARGRTTLRADEQRAELVIGELFRSEMKLD